MDLALDRHRIGRLTARVSPVVRGLCWLAACAAVGLPATKLCAQEIYFAQAAELSLYQDELFPQPVEQTTLYPRNGLIRQSEGTFYVTARQPAAPVAPLQPLQPLRPLTPPPTPPDQAGPNQPSQSNFTPDASAFGGLAEASPAPPGGASVGAAEASSSGASDLAGLLSQSQNVQSVEVSRRNPVALDPNIRGYKAGQIYSQANGTYLLAARPDLDTQLSKIDPGLIQTVTVIPGPYGLRYGPGFAFVDIETVLTPRYENGFETHFRSNGDVRANGGQVYGRETVYGGNSDWGFRFSYGHRKGSDYDAGDGTQIPASYNNRDVLGEIGYSINPDQRIEFAFSRLDQVDTDYAAQFFDINALSFYNFNLRLIDEDPCHPWDKFTVESWYNCTRFSGDNENKANPNFPVIQRLEFSVDQFLGLPTQSPMDPDGSTPQNPITKINAITNGGVISSGTRSSMLFGDVDEAFLRVGADYRYVEQNISELLNVSRRAPFQNTLMPPSSDITTNLPLSRLNDTGIYAETSLPLTSFWTPTVGARVDYVTSMADGGDLRPNSQLPPGPPAVLDVLEQDSVLYAFYLNNEVELNPCYTMRVGFGHAQRPATLVERYADGLFLGVVQSGFTRVIGDPRLLDERNWQIDVGLDANLDCFRGRTNLFYAWIQDYITFADDFVQTPPGFTDARLLRYINTDHATLAGFDVSGEYDLTRTITPFASMRYVEGRDQVINAPLPSIPPLDSTVGFRFHDACQGKVWSTELAARIVDQQDRLGGIRLAGGVTPLEEQTPAFTVWHLRSYWNYSDNLRFNAGIDNLFDKVYQEHLDLRLLTPGGFAPTRVLSPGITPYFGLSWTY